MVQCGQWKVRMAGFLGHGLSFGSRDMRHCQPDIGVQAISNESQCQDVWRIPTRIVDVGSRCGTVEDHCLWGAVIGLWQREREIDQCSCKNVLTWLVPLGPLYSPGFSRVEEPLPLLWLPAMFHFTTLHCSHVL